MLQRTCLTSLVGVGRFENESRIIKQHFFGEELLSNIPMVSIKKYYGTMIVGMVQCNHLRFQRNERIRCSRHILCVNLDSFLCDRYKISFSDKTLCKIS